VLTGKGNAMKKIFVIGAGMGGLTAAARLAAKGLAVTVLEAHVYPGGCAGTFYHQGYRFDAGATLAGGFYPNGPMDLVARLIGIERWPVYAGPAEVMSVHLPDGSEVLRLAGEERWAEYRAAFGRAALSFWRWQEETADALWDLALRLPPWPPKNAADYAQTAAVGLGWLSSGKYGKILPSLARDARRTVSSHLEGLPEKLRHFVDAQLLISAQADSSQANALYGAAALDLPRRGVVYPKEGMGSIPRRLAQAVQENGGEVLYRQEAVKIRLKNGRPVGVETRRGDFFGADVVIANLTPWNIAALLQDALPNSLQNLTARPEGWGAFILYAGVDGEIFPPGIPLHQQVVKTYPLGEGNTVFISTSPAWDKSRAPAGKRAVTLSTHTALEPWWDLHQKDPQGYQDKKEAYTARLMKAAESILPGFRDAAGMVLPGTPLSFQRFTRRAFGWVGGFPQTDLFQSPPPQLSPGLWMVGDSIFPGQSTAAAALGGLCVAQAVLQKQPLREAVPSSSIQTEIR
jgi:C-3',4' desaturase CrtD